MRWPSADSSPSLSWHGRVAKTAMRYPHSELEMVRAALDYRLPGPEAAV